MVRNYAIRLLAAIIIVAIALSAVVALVQAR